MNATAHRRLTLAIEISNPSTDPASPGSVCIGETPSGAPPTVLATQHLAPRARHDDALAPAIAGVLENAGAAPADVARLAVSIGPGGFTALRIAAVTAKLFSEATGAACVAVPTAAVAAWGPGLSGVFAVALASKGESAWVAVYRRDGVNAPPTPLHEGSLCDAAAMCRLHAATPLASIIADRFLPASFAAWAAENRVEIRPLVLRAEDCLRAAAGLPDVDPIVMAPLYPREPEAVSKWRELHG